jgi:hypothetical protein
MPYVIPSLGACRIPAGMQRVQRTLSQCAATKWLSLLREASPTIERVAIATNTENHGERTIQAAVEAACHDAELPVVIVPAQHSSEPAKSREQVGQAANHGLIVLPGIATNASQRLIVDLASRLRVPAMYPFRFFTESGGLMSYGVDSNDLVRRAAFTWTTFFVAQILVICRFKVQISLNL